MASFESTIVSISGAPIDRRLAGDLSALSPEAEIGFALFKKADCMACHAPPLFTDLGFHNNGMEFAAKNRVSDDGLFTTIRNSRNFTPQQRQLSIRAFKTPTLREIQRTAPYTHAGNFLTLRRVLEHYNSGGAKLVNGRALADSLIDRRIRPLGYNSRSSTTSRFSCARRSPAKPTH